MSTTPCGRPVADPTLVDYWVGELPEAEEAQLEAHLFDCDACGERARELADLAEGIGRVARRLPPRSVVPRALLERWIQDGLRVRIFDVAPDAPAHCFVDAGDDLVVGRLSADLSSAARIDLAVYDEHGREAQRFEDVPADRTRGEVLVARQGAHARTLPAVTIRFKLLAVKETGERTLGSYTLLHRAFAP